MPALRDAFTAGRGCFGTAPRVCEDQSAKDPGSSFKDGAEWVNNILIPAIEQGNAELQPENVAFQLDHNLDPRSTNHAHADFWLAEMGEGQRAPGPRYSINVIGGQTVWLYKPGVPGHVLGTLEQCGPDTVGELLRRAAEEFGKQLGKTTARG